MDDAIWFAVNEMFTTRGPHTWKSKPASKYPLTGIARCGSCDGAVAAARVRAYGGAENERVVCYTCAKHRERGPAVCPVNVHQPMQEIEGALIEYLQENVLSEGVLSIVLAEVRNEIAAQIPKHEADTAAIEADLATARAEQKRLAKAVAMADDVPELVVELRKRSARIQQLEGQLIAAKHTPDDLAAIVTRVETNARARLQELREALAERRDLREVFMALFPDGLKFTPTRTPDGARKIFAITGRANLRPLLGGVGSDCIATPTCSIARWTAKPLWNWYLHRAGGVQRDRLGRPLRPLGYARKLPAIFASDFRRRFVPTKAAVIEPVSCVCAARQEPSVERLRGREIEEREVATYQLAQLPTTVVDLIVEVALHV